MTYRGDGATGVQPIPEKANWETTSGGPPPYYGTGVSTWSATFWLPLLVSSWTNTHWLAKQILAVLLMLFLSLIVCACPTYPTAPSDSSSLLGASPAICTCVVAGAAVLRLRGGGKKRKRAPDRNQPLLQFGAAAAAAAGAAAAAATPVTSLTRHAVLPVSFGDAVPSLPAERDLICAAMLASNPNIEKVLSTLSDPDSSTFLI